MNDSKVVNNKVNKIGGYIAVAFLIGMLIFIFYKRHQLLHHFAFTLGRVTEITKPGWKNYGDYSVLYEYKVNGKRYNANSNFKYCQGQSMAIVNSLLVGKIFPVAYAIESPIAATLLLTQDNADQFKYTLPDSVRYYDSVLTCK
jgi:hypothetical protein